MMQVEHEQLETKIKEGKNQLNLKREEYLKFRALEMWPSRRETDKEGFQMDF